MKWAGWSGWPDVNPIIPGLPAFECTAALDERVIREVDLLFAPVAQRVDDYLDWYFTVLGEYERLTGAVMGDFAKHMEQKFAEELFTATDFHARLAGIDQGLAQDALAQMTAVSHVVKEHLAAQVQAQPCVLVALDPQGLDQLNRDQWRAGGAALTGVVTGTTMVVRLGGHRGTLGTDERPGPLPGRGWTPGGPALEHDLVLVTRNVRDIELSGVRYFNPFEEPGA